MSPRTVLLSAAREVLAGAVAGAVTLAYCVSFAALIFRGLGADGFAVGLSAALIAAAMCCIVLPLLGSSRNAVGGPETPVVAVMAVMSALVVRYMPDASLAEQIATVAAALSITAVFTGAFMLLLWWRRMSFWITFLPYPVIGGFLGASGWLLIVGGVKLLGWDGRLAALPQVFALEWAGAPAWTALAFSGALIALNRRPGFRFGVPAALGTAMLAGALASILLGDVAPAGWFVPEGDPPALWTPWLAMMTGGVDAAVLLRLAPEACAVALVSALSVALNASTLDLVRNRDTDIDAELGATGFATVVSGALGGLAGGLSLNRTVMSGEIGGRLPVSALICGGVCLLGLTGLLDAAHLTPVPVLAGLLMFVGATILISAAAGLQKIAHRWDIALTAAIFVMIVTFGYLEGIVLGVVAACIAFAVNYSRAPEVRVQQTRANRASRVVRPPADERFLVAQGHRIVILQLQGFLFFGSINRLLGRVKAAFPAGAPQTRWLILDCAQLTGIDSSVQFGLARLMRFAGEQVIRVQLARASADIRRALLLLRVVDIKTFDDLFSGDVEEALELAESELLAQYAGRSADVVTFASWMHDSLGPQAATVLTALELRDVAAGAVLCEQGTPSDSLFLVVSGQVSVRVATPHGQSRIRTMLGQTVIGEMGFFRDAPRSATVVADAPAVVAVLTRASWDRLRDQAPDSARALLEFVVRTIADRLDFANQAITALER